MLSKNLSYNLMAYNASIYTKRTYVKLLSFPCKSIINTHSMLRNEEPINNGKVLPFHKVNNSAIEHCTQRWSVPKCIQVA